MALRALVLGGVAALAGVEYRQEVGRTFSCRFLRSLPFRAWLPQQAQALVDFQLVGVRAYGRFGIGQCGQHGFLERGQFALGGAITSGRRRNTSARRPTGMVSGAVGNEAVTSICSATASDRWPVSTPRR